MPYALRSQRNVILTCMSRSQASTSWGAESRPKTQPLAWHELCLRVRFGGGLLAPRVSRGRGRSPGFRLTELCVLG